MVKRKRLSSTMDETVQSLSDEVDIDQHLATYLQQNVEQTFEIIQKSTKEVLEYLCAVQASNNYINAVLKVEELMEAVQQPIWAFIKKHSTDNTSKRSPQTHKTITKRSRKAILQTKNKKSTKILKTKSSIRKMNKTPQTKKKDASLELDTMDRTKYEISVLDSITENDRNVRRSQRVKYPPINRWAGEKLVRLHDGSYGLIKSKTAVKPELVLANKKILTKLKNNNKSRRKRLQTKKPNTLTISKRRDVNKNDKTLKTDRGSSKNRRRTLYSPTRWLDSLNSTSDRLYVDCSTNSNQ